MNWTNSPLPCVRLWKTLLETGTSRQIGLQEQAISRCFWPRLKVRHDYEDGFLRFVSVKWNSSDHEEHWNVNELKDLHMRIRLHYKDLRARLVFICKARLLSGFKFLITLCCIFTRKSGRKETHSKNDIFRWKTFAGKGVLYRWTVLFAG